MNPQLRSAAAAPSRIAFFAHERGDARVRKRIAALQDLGWHVAGFTFHREREKADTPPNWENIHLGTTYNRRYLQRLFAFLRSVGVLWWHRERLADCPLVYAVNTDNALLSLLGMCFAGRPVPLVLELADIQPAMTGRGLLSRIFRAVERFVLRRTDLLVTTSPGFVREYFIPYQAYDGGIFLLENKVYPVGGLADVRVSSDRPVSGGRPWVVGCFGAFRCHRSLELMRALAEHLPGRVRFLLRGYPSGTIAGEFNGLTANHKGIDFGGPYSYPCDLPAMYEKVDFNWAFDESDPSGNSAWLLPNRIYEGAFFGVPAIAGKATETGRWIEKNGLGWTFEEPLAESLAAFFESIGPAEWSGVKHQCMSRPPGDFSGDDDYTELSRMLTELAMIPTSALRRDLHC
jgi:succinoglycan biosynthesis protein ExoL